MCSPVDAGGYPPRLAVVGVGAVRILGVVVQVDVLSRPPTPVVDLQKTTLRAYPLNVTLGSSDNRDPLGGHDVGGAVTSRAPGASTFVERVRIVVLAKNGEHDGVGVEGGCLGRWSEREGNGQYGQYNLEATGDSHFL